MEKGYLMPPKIQILLSGKPSVVENEEAKTPEIKNKNIEVKSEIVEAKIEAPQAKVENVDPKIEVPFDQQYAILTENQRIVELEKQLKEAEKTIQTLKSGINTVNLSKHVELLFLLITGDLSLFKSVLAAELVHNPGIRSDPVYVETAVTMFGHPMEMFIKLFRRLDIRRDVQEKEKEEVLNNCIVKEIIDGLLENKFNPGSSLNILMRKYGKYTVGTDNRSNLNYVLPLPEARKLKGETRLTVADQDDPDDTILDTMFRLTSVTDFSTIDDEILVELSEYSPNIIRGMIENKLDLKRIVSGKPIGYWLMRVAENTVYLSCPTNKDGTMNPIMETNTVAYRIFVYLKNHPAFDPSCIDWFVGCENEKIIIELAAYPAFCTAVTKPMADGKSLVESIKSTQAGSRLLQLGCPKSGLGWWSKELANSMLLAQSYFIRGKCDITPTPENDYTPLFSVIMNGDFSKANYDVVRHLCKVTTNSFLSLDCFRTGLKWNPLHLMCYRFKFASYVDKQKIDKSQPVRLLDNSNKCDQQLEILRYLFANVQAKIDAYGRTPLMCIEFKIPFDQFSEYLPFITELYKTLAPLELNNFAAQKNPLQISADQYVLRLIEWKREEMELRKKEAEKREQAANTDIIQKHFKGIFKSA